MIEEGPRGQGGAVPVVLDGVEVVAGHDQCGALAPPPVPVHPTLRGGEGGGEDGAGRLARPPSPSP